MSAADQPFYVFEHPAFTDAFDAQRQSRLYGFRYTTDHAKYGALCDALRARLSPEVLAVSLGTPLEKVPDNTALYIVRLTPEARETVLPVLLEEAVARGFSVLDDMQGRCHCPAGIWTIDGLQPAVSA